MPVENEWVEESKESEILMNSGQFFNRYSDLEVGEIRAAGVVRFDHS